MWTMKEELGREVEWVAVIHQNTDNHHVHISLRGVDEKGRALDIEEYLGRNLRIQCQEMVTRTLGPRLYPEILQRREAELYERRVTETDRILIWRADESNILTVPMSRGASWSKSKGWELERVRLRFLAGLGLAEQISGETWSLNPQIKEHLGRLALREQIIREQAPGWEFVRTLEKSGVVRKRLALGDKVTGRVAGMDIRDPFGDKRFILIESIDGSTYHLNQPR